LLIYPLPWSFPSQEGKGILFKRFSGINVFDIEINVTDVEKVVEVVTAMEPTFGGINLEDIKAPECFLIEEECKKRMSIPVFHDDQHGTAIITAAGLKNACEIQGKKLEEVRVVCIGAGASAIACMTLWVELGVSRGNIFMLDSRGVVRHGRGGRPLGPYKEAFARPEGDGVLELETAMAGADVVVGLSSGGKIPEAFLQSMAPNPIIFALANPDPEVDYHVARKLRPDAIVATGRSDFPNQVNNVLGFPFIFRGALDVGATTINEEMKLAAVAALAALAKEPVPEVVKAAYADSCVELSFGKEYITPKPFDPRALVHVSSAVAAAAMETGVACAPVDLIEYRESLNQLARRLAKKASL
jgi:malate dehydrogenase (oxaloacetate-decarboxylating)(NADP+)